MLQLPLHGPGFNVRIALPLSPQTKLETISPAAHHNSPDEHYDEHYSMLNPKQNSAA